MKTTLILLTFAALTLTSGLATARSADDPLQQQAQLLHAYESFRPDARITQSGGMSLSQAIASVRSRTNGKIVGAETRVQGRCEVHYIKVLKDGTVKTHKVNGRCR